MRKLLWKSYKTEQQLQSNRPKGRDTPGKKQGRRQWYHALESPKKNHPPQRKGMQVRTVFGSKKKNC